MIKVINTVLYRGKYQNCKHTLSITNIQYTLNMTAQTDHTWSYFIVLIAQHKENQHYKCSFVL